VALPEATKDSDLALDSRSLGSDPLIEDAMRSANFMPNPDTGQPGSWINTYGIPVDLMVPTPSLAPAAAEVPASLPTTAGRPVARSVSKPLSSTMRRSRSALSRRQIPGA